MMLMLVAVLVVVIVAVVVVVLVFDSPFAVVSVCFFCSCRFSKLCCACCRRRELQRETD